MDARYNVYFAGQLLEGQELATVREKLAKLFNADQQTLDKLFSGKAQLLKRDCDKATALKYKQSMERAGAQPLIKASQGAATGPAPTPAPTKTLSAAERIAALAAAADESSYRSDASAPTTDQAEPQATNPEGMNLAPAGADVLREEERPKPVTREVDTAGLEVDTAAQRLSEEPPAPPAAPDTSHLHMGAVGEMIPNLPSDQAPLTPNIEAIDLAPQGTDFTDCAAPEAETPTLDLSGMDLAPTGTDVLEEKYRKHEQAVAPSTDHISLED